jgi:metallo-beta-lactamase family protein
MKIKFLGAAGTVTGSSYVLTSGSGQSILIDLGMFQGPEIDRFNYLPYEFDCSTLAGAILTHAHLDHCGRLPIILPQGFTGSIWMTSPTADLTELSLRDSAKIARLDGKRVLYDDELAIATIQRFQRAHYRTPQPVGDFIVTFRDAGHIMGSALLEIVDTKPDSDIKKIIFSGDLGNSPEDLLHETEIPGDADAVVMESTYGDRLHPKEDPRDAITREINAVEQSGGTLLIPAFSLQRTQELLHMIMHLKVSGKIQGATPIFMDSPMAETATQIYTRYPEDFNEHIQEEMHVASPFEFPGLVNVGRRNQSQAIHKTMGAKVIIAGSGMMTGGRIVSHAAQYLPLPNTRLLIVGFQGEDTLGRELKEGRTNVLIDEKSVHVRAAVNHIETMSSHADQGQLLGWLKPIKGVKKVFLTHGEDGPRAALAKKIEEDLGITDVAMPTLNQELVL